jgi:hypothetical protein
MSLKKLKCDVAKINNPKRLIIAENPQGDITIQIKNENESHSDKITFCGPGGGSEHPGLATAIKQATTTN